ncbi:hypothetical protein DRF65_13845 [Chryseobacterium pennae]|uniref:N-acetyltransferase domain-containing protein n=1 Tax=Chryseobacterium pennae TaxID=2258962 RepID=A0A3D9C8A5_9FLAO|nr:GNAT family N-acetyltransferase [Chryseobacterium pennae]REC61816.1 hypothetical protein DRF65_13845 [Chryseobacterium pennae]
MMLTPIEINFSPDESDLSEIFTWTTFPSNNWSEIQRCFENNCLAVAIQDGKTIGFIAYKYEDLVCIYVSMAETKMDFQKRGVAKFMIDNLRKKYLYTEYKAFILTCAPKETKYIWEKIGFETYPEGARYDDKTCMFLIFGNVCKVEPIQEYPRLPANRIEIWDSAGNTENEKAKWTAPFQLKEGSNMLVQPALFFGNYDWIIEITHNGKSKKMRYKDYNGKRGIYECIYIDEIK